jgi:hypothetical protein
MIQIGLMIFLFLSSSQLHQYLIQKDKQFRVQYKSRQKYKCTTYQKMYQNLWVRTSFGTILKDDSADTNVRAPDKEVAGDIRKDKRKAKARTMVTAADGLKVPSWQNWIFLILPGSNLRQAAPWCHNGRSKPMLWLIVDDSE